MTLQTVTILMTVTVVIMIKDVDDLDTANGDVGFDEADWTGDGGHRGSFKHEHLTLIYN